MWEWIGRRHTCVPSLRTLLSPPSPFFFPSTVCVNESESCLVMSNSLQHHGLYSLWNSPGQDTGVGSLSLLQGIFPTQGLNPGLPHCRRILYQLSHNILFQICISDLYKWVMGFPGGASGKEPTCQCEGHGRCRFDPWVGEIPWRRARQPTHSSILAWRIPWTEEPGGLESIGLQRLLKQLSTHITHTFI